MEAFLGVLEEGLQRGDVTVTQGQLLCGDLEVELQFVVVDGQLVLGAGGKVQLLL